MTDQPRNARGQFDFKSEPSPLVAALIARREEQQSKVPEGQASALLRQIIKRKNTNLTPARPQVPLPEHDRDLDALLRDSLGYRKEHNA